MKNLILLSIAALSTGCASTSGGKPWIENDNLERLSAQAAITDICSQLGYYDEEQTAGYYESIGYVLNTWAYDLDRFKERRKFYYDSEWNHSPNVESTCVTTVPHIESTVRDADRHKSGSNEVGGQEFAKFLGFMMQGVEEHYSNGGGSYQRTTVQCKKYGSYPSEIKTFEGSLCPVGWNKML